MAMSSSESTPARPRVLVVDDSAFMRRLVSDLIAERGEFEVIGTARDGVHAVSQVRALNPDIVTLDVDMPAQDGLAALRQIMQEMPRPVVMLSAGGSDGGADATLRALELGAIEFVRKPSGAISLDLAVVQEQLLDALRAAATVSRETLLHHIVPRAAGSHNGSTIDGPSMPTAFASFSNESASAHASATHLICIASSTGGPAALAQIIPKLPRFPTAAVCIAQHMPPGFTRSLALRLNSGGKLTVHEAAHGDRLLAGHAYLAPGGFHLRVRREHGAPVCALDDGPTLWGVRPAADHLFQSAAEVYGAQCTGVVLTGMGCDGADGLFAVRHGGGWGIVQDEQSAVVPGMPMSALRHAGADAVSALAEMAATITALVQRVPRASERRLA
jgi:two-component system chemotaxis response regulator CheB